MKKVLLLTLSLILSTNLFAKKVDENEENSNKYGFSENQQYPFDKNQQETPPYVQEKRFKLDLQNNEVEDFRRKMDKHSDIMEGTLDISILQKPLIKILKTVDTIYLHPSYINTIILPKQLKISSCLPSFETAIFDYSQNILRIQPTKMSKNGNISISLTDGNQNYTMNIFVKKYFKEDKCVNNGSNYVCSDDYLSTIIKYVPSKALDINSKLQIVEDYLMLTKKTKLDIKKNLEYVTLQKGNETFFIIRDDEFGDIYRNGIAFTIKNALN